MDYDVIIVGGGLAGLALAVALRRSRLTVALVEGQTPRDSRDGWDARVYAISPANVAFLERMGVWEHLDAARLAPVSRMAVRGDANGALDFSAYECGVAELAWIVESSHLHGELWESARRQGNLDLLCPARPAGLKLDKTGVALELADRRTIRGRLAVAADGAYSWTRQMLGVEVDFAHYHQMGVVANFTTASPHRGTAWQWFRDGGVLAWLPLPGNRMSMVWSLPDAQAKALLALSAADLCAHVAAAGGGVLGDLELLTPTAAFPLRLMRAPRTVGERFALIGDAAHTIHPLSGHGINLGFQDACSLAAVLEACPQHIDCGEVQWLRRHERARREEVLVLQKVTDGLQHLFARPSPPLSILRNAGMSLLDRLPVMKSLLVRYAMGQIG